MTGEDKADRNGTLTLTLACVMGDGESSHPLSVVMEIMGMSNEETIDLEMKRNTCCV